jgi:glutamate synthase (NADPH/NADH) small chain
VLLCCGAKQPRALNVPGIDSEGVYFAVDFLTAATKQVLGGNGAISAKDLDVVIVGGGDTGNDCVGTSIRLGARSVTQLEMMPSPPVQRTPDNPWPDWPRTLKTDYGQQEAIAVFGHDPRLFETTVNRVVPDSHGRVSAVETVKLKGRDKVSGSEQLIPCQLLLIAAGFTGCQSYIPKAFGMETDERGNIKTVRYGTNIPKLFAAGDARRGQSLVVWAISEGLAAAKSIDEYLMGYSEM